jgi:hypothetical protein
MDTSTVSASGPPSEWPLKPPIPEGPLVRYVVLAAGSPRHGTRGWWADVAVIVPRILDISWWNAPHMIIFGISFLMYLHTSMDKQ